VLNYRPKIRIPARNPRSWESLTGVTATAADVSGSPLREVENFGSNPGALRMLTYSPLDLAPGSALVVVLHGCTQTAAGYDVGAGWSTLADRYGFALLFPQQQKLNNPNGCFNWFLPGDTKRDRGEAHSIREMVERIVRNKRIDRDRVFVTGLSAGGAMTSVMLATYPEVFAGGAIIAGLPYGAANNVQQAFESMYQSPARPAREWGDLVRAASPHTGPWPRVSVWHGTGDTTVIPANAVEILKQWTDVHALPDAPSRQEIVAGYPRQVWRNAAGDDLIESYTITNMAHGTPLAVGNGDGQGGAAGPFLLDVGISSSYHIAKFWGLTEQPRTSGLKAAAPVAMPAGRPHLEAAARAEPEPHIAAEPTSTPHARPADIRGIITRALKAAGLMKGT
jgi:poly(hydroxyalkanoate) depolymerase family esterase